ncbi:MAG: 50S ribosomal protein L3 [Nitrososphaeria archaeon]
MGHRKKNAPRHGSLAFRPRVRADGIVPRVRYWGCLDSPRPSLLGFIGFKAGMMHTIISGENPRSPTFGKPVFRASTVLVCPPIRICGIRLYGENVEGEYALTEVYSDKLPKFYERALPKGCLAKKYNVSVLDKVIESVKRVVAIVGAEPHEAKLSQKKPIILEVEIGGGKSVKDRIEYAKSILGSTIRVKDVFKAGDFVDTIGITKGKGFQGPVKRFGIKRKQHKSRKSVRAVGCLGAWHPAAVTYTVPRAGQMGFHQRTSYNKRILICSSTEKGMVFNPAGGFKHFGIVKGDYLVLDGSVQGPPKRPIVLRFAVRSKVEKPTTPKIIYTSVSLIPAKSD